MTCFNEIQLLKIEIRSCGDLSLAILSLLTCVLFTKAAKVWSSLGCGVARDRHRHPAARDLGCATLRRRRQIVVNIPGASYLNWEIGLINI